MAAPRKYPEELRERAIRLVLEDKKAATALREERQGVHRTVHALLSSAAGKSAIRSPWHR